MTSAYLYVRVSTDKQKKKGFSLTQSSKKQQSTRNKKGDDKN